MHANPKTNAPGWSNFLELMRMARPPKWIFFVAIGLSLFEAAAGLIVPIFTRDLIDQFGFPPYWKRTRLFS